jgi:hypothetical protein
MKPKHLIFFRDILVIPLVPWERIDDYPEVQENRRRVHEKYGLTENEWTAAQNTLKHYDAMGVAQQRGEWLTNKCSRLERTPGDSTEAMNEISRAYRKLSDEKYRNQEVYKLNEKLMNEALHSLKHTAIGRAIHYSRRRPGRHLSPWLRLRCVEAGGCCGRSCQCCQKLQDIKKWAGHCTPACGCCMEHQGTDQLIETLQDPIELGYNIRPSKEDTFSRNMMDALIWKPFVSQM